MPSEYHGVLILPVVLMLFEDSKQNMMLYFLIGAVLFGWDGIAICTLYWAMFMLPRMAFDFFSHRGDGLLKSSPIGGL